MDPQEISQATRSFVTPIELSGSLPRDVQLNGGGRFVSAMAIVLFAGALIASLLLGRLHIRQAEQRDMLERSGVQATAEVTRLWRATDDSKQPWAAYRFDVSGVTYGGRAKMRLSRWRALQTGAHIDVRYLPQHPDTNVLAGSEPDVLPVFVPFLLATLLATGGVLIFWAVNCQRRLLAEGRAAAAIVTDVVKHKTSHGGTQRSVKYTFRLLSGAVATGKSDAPRKLPAIGSVIWVVYDPDRPRRSRRYPFPFVKTARL